MQNHNEKASINQLTGSTSNAIGEFSYLVDRIEQLCDKPISDFEIEDYRILINQGIALKHIVPPTIDILSQDLFAEGDYFEGDLLKSILTIDQSFWQENPILKEKLRLLCLLEFDTINTLDLSESIKENLSTLVRSF